MNFIDLFAGAGGLSEGFIRNGFTPVAHVEMDKNASFTLKTRLAYYHLLKTNNIEIYYGYLRGEISRDELYRHLPEGEINSVINKAIGNDTLKEIFDSIDSRMVAREVKEIDLIVGGPPCQAYSIVGRARSDKGMKGDPRNYLYVFYAEFLRRYRPKMFVFENVRGLYSANNGKILEHIGRILDKSGYYFEIQEQNSNNYGVLQNRRRLIIIGWRQDQANLHYPVLENVEHNFQVADLLADLPPVAPGRTYIGPYTLPTTQYLEQSHIRNGCPIITQHTCRPHRAEDLEIYKLAIELWESEKRRLYYPDLPENLLFHANRTSFTDRFKVVASDLNASHTIVAHISRDGHYYIHPDLQQLRSLSIREAARIQSFPDDFFFEGSRSSAFKQIGNAVPPLMADKIASGIRSLLELNR